MNIVEFLKQNKIKATAQRVVIAELLYNHRHLNIDEIYKRTVKQFPTISLSTVYKNVNTMLELGILQEVSVPNQKPRYELNERDHHAHLICTTCSKITDININSKKVLEALEIKNQSNLKIEEIAISIFVKNIKEDENCCEFNKNS
jgi:Fur family peroxide stress response transcriptional regulator